MWPYKYIQIYIKWSVRPADRPTDHRKIAQPPYGIAHARIYSNLFALPGKCSLSTITRTSECRLISRRPACTPKCARKRGNKNEPNIIIHFVRGADCPFPSPIPPFSIHPMIVWHLVDKKCWCLRITLCRLPFIYMTPTNDHGIQLNNGRQAIRAFHTCKKTAPSQIWWRGSCKQITNNDQKLSALHSHIYSNVTWAWIII